MKSLGRIFAALLVLTLFTGCGRADHDATEQPQRIYLVVKASESEFWQIVMAGARAKGQELGVEVVTQAPVSESDVSRQVSILETAIAARPGAIVLAPTVADALVPGIERASRAGIPVIIIDSQANTDQYVSFLASDNLRIGELAADKLAAAMKERFGEAKGEVAGLTFMSGVGSLEQRRQGFLNRLREAYPDIRVVAFQDAQGRSGASLAIVQNYLTAYPNLRGIFANNQPTGDETVRALDNAQRKDLAVVVVDAGPQEVWGLGNGYVDAMIVQQPWMMGAMGVEYALRAVNGETLSREVDTGVVAITPAMLVDGEAVQYLDPLAYHGAKK